MSTTGTSEFELISVYTKSYTDNQHKLATACGDLYYNNYNSYNFYILNIHIEFS